MVKSDNCVDKCGGVGGYLFCHTRDLEIIFVGHCVRQFGHFLNVHLYVMLPRHLRSLALSRRSSGTPGLIILSHSSRSHPPPFRIHHTILHGRRVAAFHSSSSRHNELPKSPFATFVEVLRDELKKNRELQDNVKQLQGDVDKLQDSEAMKQARAAYERARVRCIRY